MRAPCAMAAMAGEVGCDLAAMREKVAAAVGFAARRMWRRKDLQDKDLVILDLLVEALARLGQLYGPRAGQPAAAALAAAPPRIGELVAKLAPVASVDLCVLSPEVDRSQHGGQALWCEKQAEKLKEEKKPQGAFGEKVAAAAGGAEVFADSCGAGGGRWHWQEHEGWQPRWEASAAGSSRGGQRGRGEQTEPKVNFLASALWDTCSGGKWADAAVGQSDAEDELGWLGASERSSTTSAVSTPAQSMGGAGRRKERRRLQQVKLRLAKECEEKDVMGEVIVPMESNDELLQLTQRRLGRGLNPDEVRVLEAMGAKFRAALFARIRDDPDDPLNQ